MIAALALAAAVTITRDDWGIAHVHGKTDADAVYGMAYAQAEDDFNRVETNYLAALGWRAQAEGASALYSDLRQRLYVNADDLKARYKTSPAWLQALMNAWAAGLNAYIDTHPSVHPKVIHHFEPWMALSFTEGSIGGDIERINLDRLQSFYGDTKVARGAPDPNAAIADPPGSNGIAIAPSNTLSHHALLLINPHTSFYFRSELQMTSDEGLNAYGAVTWGQFFIYQGFNEHIGWMHTSTGADNVDQFAESIVKRGGRIFYRYGNQLRLMRVSKVTIPYRRSDGTMAHRSFIVYHTHRGPIVGMQDGKWIAQAMMYRPVEALEQSYLRTKATDYASFHKIAELKANSSNNTIFADSKGEIAYMHPQFIPLRDNRFDYTKLIDGSNPAADWRGITPLEQDPHILNPTTGYIFNDNDWPYNAAGSASPKRADFPRYMDTAGENARGVHAFQLLDGKHDFTLDSLVAAAYDSRLPFFQSLLPALFAAYEANPDPALAEPISSLHHWDEHWSLASVPTTLAVYWAEALTRSAGNPRLETLLATTREQKVAALSTAVAKLNDDFGTWRTRWGDINRFQRLNDSIAAMHDDNAPSIPVPFVAGIWGSLASFATPPSPNMKKRYGGSGNSFVAVVEFGDRVRAVAVTAGGESGDVTSPHFNDQAARYASGDLRPVYFYPDELAGHIERTYHIERLTSTP